MKKKGFTLIELLAVIIILAIVALIATPKVLDIIEDVRRSSFERSVEGYYQAAEYIYDQMFLNGTPEDINFIFKDGVQTSSNDNYKIEVSGEKVKGGVISLYKNGHILVNVHNGQLCATTNSKGEISISETIENCEVAPSECFTYSDVTLSTFHLQRIERQHLEFEGMNDPLLQIDSFDSNNPSCKGIVIIPEEHEGRKVEGIKDNVFLDNASITNVVLPKELKVIGQYAFSNMANLNEVVFNEELRVIDSWAFKNAIFKELTIPEKVASFGSGAFMNLNLDRLEILNPMNILESFDVNFTGKQSPFSRANINWLYLGPKVEGLSGVTFSGTINTVEFAFGIKDLTTFHLNNRGIQNIIIPKSVISIGSETFKNNQLSDDQAFIYKRNSDGTIDNTTVVSYGGAKKDNIVIPDGVITIENGAFYSSQITSITLPSSVTSIGENSFGNNQLTSLVIPSTVTSIGVGAFSNNSFPDASAITLEGDATRFDRKWTSIGFPSK